jgi:hypothetical protein
MDKNIVITMGCSHTEGLGCWEDKHIPKDYTTGSKKFTNLEHEAIYENNKPYFQKYGWPSLITKKIGYDVLYNMGQSATSISGQTKKLIERFHNEDFSEFENKILIWLLNFEPRISLYLKGIITNIMHNAEDELEKNFYYSYIKLLEYNAVSENETRFGEADLRLEHIYNIRVVQEFCKNRNIKFIPLVIKDYEGWLSYLAPDIKFYYTRFTLLRTFENLISPVCGHLNRDGYQSLANKIFDMLEMDNDLAIFKNKDNIESFSFDNSTDFTQTIKTWKKKWIEND